MKHVLVGPLIIFFFLFFSSLGWLNIQTTSNSGRLINCWSEEGKIFCKGFRETPRWNKGREISWNKRNGNLILEKPEFVLLIRRRNEIYIIENNSNLLSNFLWGLVYHELKTVFRFSLQIVLYFWLMRDQPDEPFPARIIPCLGCLDKKQDTDCHFLQGYIFLK